MEVIQTYIVKTNVVLETLNYYNRETKAAYTLLFECEKKNWFIRIGDQLELISPESAIHIRCNS